MKSETITAGLLNDIIAIRKNRDLTDEERIKQIKSILDQHYSFEYVIGKKIPNSSFPNSILSDTPLSLFVKKGHKYNQYILAFVPPSASHGKKAHDMNIRPDQVIPVEDARKLPEYKEILDMGWREIGTAQQVKNGTMVFGFPDVYLELGDDPLPVAKNDNIAVERMKVHPQRLLLYKTGYIRTMNLVNVHNDTDVNITPIGSYDPRTEEGWKEGLEIVKKNMMGKMKKWKKQGWTVYSTPEERYDVRGKIAGKSFGF